MLIIHSFSAFFHECPFHERWTIIKGTYFWDRSCTNCLRWCVHPRDAAITLTENGIREPQVTRLGRVDWTPVKNHHLRIWLDSLAPWPLIPVFFFRTLNPWGFLFPEAKSTKLWLEAFTLCDEMPGCGWVADDPIPHGFKFPWILIFLPIIVDFDGKCRLNIRTATWIPYGNERLFLKQTKCLL